MPSKDVPAQDTQPAGDVWLGIALVGLAVVVVSLAQSIRALGLGDNFDPGSKAFPVGLAVVLGIGGLIEVWQGWQSGPAAKAAPGQTKTAAILLLGLGAYVWLLPWLGFAVSTLVGATAMMVWLGNPWSRSLIASVVLIGVIYALFVIGFKVPLPGGVLNLPF